MKEKNFTLIVNHFEREHFSKDVVLVPLYIQRVYGGRFTIVYPQNETNKDLPESVRGIKLHPITYSGDENLNVYYRKVASYLIRNARKIDMLMTFHILMRSGKFALLYKLLNPKGKSYVKLDIPTYIIDRMSNFFGDNRLKERIKRIAYKAYFKRVDLFSCESSDAYNRIINNPDLASYFNDKLIVLENGCDDEQITELGISPKTFEEKENIILTVGRLGSLEKNTELLLQALKDVQFADWKAYLIGPLQDGFETYVENFFKEHPQLKDKIIFTGAVYDKKTLWEFYNRAKVFVLSSRTESSGIVLYEAKIFNNYIISTPVGASSDVIADGCGIITDIADPKPTTDILNDIISGKREIDVYDNIDTSHLRWSHQVKLLNPIID